MALTCALLSDEWIASLTSAERRDLVRRLRRRPNNRTQLAAQVARARVVRLSVLTTGAVVLVPWIVYLTQTLPPTYQASHWQLTWVGFDVILLSLMVLTATLGAMRRAPVMLVGFATGVLLLCDAWFDIVTASPRDRPYSVLSAVFAEVPVGVLLLVGSWRMVRVVAHTLWWIEPGQSLWREHVAPLVTPEPAPGPTDAARP